MATGYQTTTVNVSAAFEHYNSAALTDGPSPDEYLDSQERPECEDGVISIIGREYGADMYACNRRPWSS